MIEATELTRKVEDCLSEIIRLQGSYVREICTECPGPCCGRVQDLFNDKDLIYLELSGRKTNLRKRRTRKKGCLYLSPFGCTLTPLARPFACHRYLCPKLEETIKKDDPAILCQIQDMFTVIESFRSRLWKAYLDLKLG
jgi:hypothetical protein